MMAALTLGALVSRAPASVMCEPSIIARISFTLIAHSLWRAMGYMSAVDPPPPTMQRGGVRSYVIHNDTGAHH
jgi:hypothetical protein